MARSTPTLRQDGQRRVDVYIHHAVGIEDMANVLAHNLTNMGEPFPPSRGGAMKAVRDYLHVNGGGMGSILDGVSQQTVFLAFRHAARLFPEFGYPTVGPNICACGHWEDQHSSYTHECLARDKALESECDCEKYTCDPAPTEERLVATIDDNSLEDSNDDERT